MRHVRTRVVALIGLTRVRDVRAAVFLSIVVVAAAGVGAGVTPGVVFAAGDSPRAADRTSVTAPGRLLEPRVCPYELFSRRLRRCTRDARGAPLSTNRFTCSVNVVASRRATLRFRVSYDGGPLTGWSPIRVDPGRSSAWFAYNLGTDLPLPAGGWTCTFVMGSVKLTIPFRTVGQTGDVVNLTVCAAKDTIGSYQDEGICRKDQSVSGLPTTGVILCSLYVAHHVGSVPKIEFLDSAGALIYSYTGKRITDSLWPVWAWTTAPAPGAFAAGAYACRVSVDGRVVETRSFTVAG